MTNTSFSSLAEHWPSSYVSRTKILEFTGGILSEKYVANLDSQGRGIPGRIRVGRKVAYPVVEVIRWLEARSTLVPERHPKVGEKAEGTPPRPSKIGGGVHEHSSFTLGRPSEVRPL